MNQTTLFLALNMMAGLSACTPERSALHKAEWLVGTWENQTERGIMYESWSRINDTSFGGRAYVVVQGDTVVFETLQLIEGTEGLTYIPTVKDQNNGAPVRFELVRQSESELLFENKAHDFPQGISYRHISSDSMVAEISGMMNGKETSRIFRMRKMD